MTEAFRPRTTAILVVVGVLSLGSALAIAALGDEGRVSSAEADAFSASAVGHRAFVALLRGTGVPVTVSRHRSGARAAGAALLVLEPQPDRVDGAGPGTEDLSAMVRGAARTLLVLPKRAAEADRDRPGHVLRAPLRPASDAASVAAAAGLEASVGRPGRATGWTGEIEGAPDLSDPQLLRSDELEPLLACDQGVLVGAYDGGIVLSDPDLLANHGLGRGENARIALAVVDAVREGTFPVLVDETLHGHVAAPGVWRELLRFPLVVVVVQGLLALGVVLWAATGRFGAPVPPPRALEPGKALLVSNTAALLRMGGHGGHAVARYLKTTVQDVARAVHAPPGLPGERLVAFLGRVGEARGVADDPVALDRVRREAALEERGSGARAVAVARRIHRWREEMTHGRRGDPGR